MKVQIIESSIKHEIDGVLVTFEQGDIRTIPDVHGEFFCKNGWAKDVDGNIETAERDVNRTIVLNVRSAKSTMEVGNG